MKKKSEIPKINVTKNYRMFGRSADNREVDLKKHRRLYESMRRYGFLPCYPIICPRDANKHLYVKEGQHRLAIAEELGLPVYWVETDVDFDVAVVNCTQKVWTPIDYAKKHAADNPDYREGLDFS